MDTINSMKKTLGERIREQRILMQMTQEELAEELCVKKSTISMYENDKVDIKGSILIELSGVCIHHRTICWGWRNMKRTYWR